MDEPWIATLLSLMGGVAMGALIKIAYDLRRGRLKQIARGVRIYSLFRRDGRYDDFDAVLSVKHEGSASEFTTLFVADIALRNRSNHDYSEFEFGITIGADYKCVHVAWEDPDQHHILTPLDLATPAEPRSGLRFRLRPFNRRDNYSLRLYLVPGGEEEAPTISAFTSPHAVQFTDDPSFATSSSSAYSSVSWGALGALIGALLATMFLQFASTRSRIERITDELDKQRLVIQVAGECSERGGRFNWATLECMMNNGGVQDDQDQDRPTTRLHWTAPPPVRRKTVWRTPKVTGPWNDLC